MINLDQQFLTDVSFISAGLEDVVVDIEKRVTIPGSYMLNDGIDKNRIIDVESPCVECWDDWSGGSSIHGGSKGSGGGNGG